MNINISRDKEPFQITSIPVLGTLILFLILFMRALSKNKTGLVGFIGLLFYFVMTVIGPIFVEFDAEPKLDQISAPPGSSLQMVTLAQNADRFRTLEDLEGHRLGYVQKTGAELFLEPYIENETLNIEFEDYSFRSGRGIPESLQGLVDGEVDALIIFSDRVKQYITNNRDAAQTETFSEIVVSNETIGKTYRLGTDTQGRDILSHVVNGGSTLILVALLAGLFSTLIAVTLGSIAALLGGYIDRGFVSAANFVLTIPQFPLLVVLAVFIGSELNNPVLLALLIASLSWPVLMRAVRAQVLSLRERDYVEAAISLDLGVAHIVFREILPNMMSFVAINFIFAVIGAMYQQVGLVFLGMAPINDYTWGVMLFFGRTRGTLFSPDSMSMVLSPVIAIVFFQVSLVLFARALEEMFDPRLRTA